MQNIKNCPKCGAELLPRKGPYGDFWGCPNYRDCGFKGVKQQSYEPSSQGFKQVMNNDQHKEIMEMLRIIYEAIQERNENNN